MENKYTVTRKTIAGDWPAIVVLAALLITAVVVYPHLPELVPSHWNFRGEVDGYSNQFWGAFALPLLAAGIYLGMLFIPYIDPKRHNYALFAPAYRALRLGLVLLIAVLYGLSLIAALGGPANLVNRAVPAAVGALFVVIGNYLPQARFNYFVGIRTPWTLANEEVWRRTHRFSGLLFVFAGLLMIVAAFLPAPVNGILGLGAVIAATVLSMLYSYLAFRRVAG